MTPMKTEGGYRIGIVREGTGMPPLAAIGRAFEVTGIVTREIVKSIGRLAGGEGREDVASPIGITRVSSDAVEEGLESYLWVLGVISLSLALLNLLPLLPLDGATSCSRWSRARAVASCGARSTSAFLSSAWLSCSCCSSLGSRTTSGSFSRPGPGYALAVASRVQIHVGNVAVGGGAPVAVQSMMTLTHDVTATTAQIAALVSAGCEIVRVAVPKNEDAAALPMIVRLSPIPVIADIHFNASLALKAIEAGVAAVRINPGNIGGPDKVEQVVTAAKSGG